jgi:dipeptidyl aminopeptidase/acylaminoacyl peptidase
LAISTLTADDLWALPRVGAPVPSPDGSRVVVPVTTYSLEDNEGTTRLWLIPAECRGAGDGRRGDPAIPLTTVDASASQPCFCPGGDRLAFVRKPGSDVGKHGDRPQLHVLPLDGGEPERLTDLPFGACDPRWFPDGLRIAFLSEVYPDAPDLEATAKRAEEEADDPMKAAVTEDRWFRYWDKWLTHGRVHHVFVLDVKTRELLDLTPESHRRFDPMDPTGEYRIAPDGREIAFCACGSEPPHDRIFWNVFTVKVPARIRTGARAGKVVCLTPDNRVEASGPIYSPDGRHIVYGMRREWDFYADRRRLVAYDRTTGKHRVLTEDWDASAMDRVFTDDGRALLVLAEEEARTAVFALDFKAALRSPRANPPRRIIRGGWLSSPKLAGDRIWLNRSTLREPPEIVSYDLTGKNKVALTAFTKPGLRGITLAAAREMTFTGAEGDPVRMWVLFPPGEKPPSRDGKPKRRRPLVHMIHGGPHGVFGDQWHWRWNAQAFAAPGHVVACVNFHGSTGRGQDYAASILGRWGDQPYDDIMLATDHLVEAGIADEKRMAVTGGSYGGYLVSWIASQTDRFACIVNHAGVCDFQTQFASDITQGRVRSMGGSLWEDIEGLDRYNPLRQAAGFRSPMLVIHGEKDYRVPYAQGLAIYAVYKARGLPARLVCYPDENHWIMKPCNSLHWYGEVLAWLKRWL